VAWRGATGLYVASPRAYTRARAAVGFPLQSLAGAVLLLLCFHFSEQCLPLIFDKKNHMRTIICLLCIFVILSSCSTSTKQQSTSVKVFLASFEKKLSENDSTILHLFRTPQKPESFFPVIEFLRNKEKDLVQCSAKFNEATISIDNDGIVIHLPVAIVGATEKESQLLSIVMKLIRKDNNFYIVNFDGEDFYNKCNYYRWQAKGVQDEANWIALVKKHLDKAKPFKSKFDSIGWFLDYKGKTYFYVLKENHDPEVKSKYQMGLIDGQGQMIVPISYDLVGTPEIVIKNVIEVQKEGKVGYYSLTGVELIEPSYDWVIPYAKSKISALAKKDTTTGWFDSEFQFHSGFPDDAAKAFIQNFEFLSTRVVYNSKELPLCIAPEEHYAPFGSIIPPAYLVRFGLFASVVGGFTIEGFDPVFSSTEDIEKKEFSIFNLSENVKLLITNFQERYLGGRFEFYSHNTITLVDNKQDTLSTTGIYGGESVSMTRKNESLLEAKITDSKWYEPEANLFGFPGYRYYEFNGKTITPKESNRRWAMTEFVKLDSSYLTGKFRFYDIKSEKVDSTSFVTNLFMDEVRKDILVHIGYIFTDQEMLDELQYNKLYNPRYKTYQEAYDASSEIDKHNLDFIASIIGPYSSEPIP
jgi:hypothetical protein